MGRIGTCDRGCSEQKLELVAAREYDGLAAFASSARRSADAFAAVAQELASRQPGADEWEAAYQSVQVTARTALVRYPEVDAHSVDWDEPVEVATTWWCAECGGIDSPQPCLGICVWRVAEWVNRTRYVQERAHALAERDVQRRFRTLLRRLVSVTPRPGRWEPGWLALQAQAQETVQTCRALRLDMPPGAGGVR